jgi:hypothetical protein
MILMFQEASQQASDASSQISDAAQAGHGAIMAFIIFGIVAGMYFLPTILAVAKKKSNAVAIGCLNFFLGWTFLGWIVSLIWALSNPQKPQVIVVNQPPSGKPEE